MFKQKKKKKLLQKLINIFINNILIKQTYELSQYRRELA